MAMATQKVWVVLYQDDVHGVFRTEAGAQKYCDAINATMKDGDHRRYKVARLDLGLRVATTRGTTTASTLGAPNAAKTETFRTRRSRVRSRSAFSVNNVYR